MNGASPQPVPLNIDGFIENRMVGMSATGNAIYSGYVVVDPVSALDFDDMDDSVVVDDERYPSYGFVIDEAVQDPETGLFDDCSTKALYGFASPDAAAEALLHLIDSTYATPVAEVLEEQFSMAM